MIPRLPPELIAHIQALAEQDETLARRKSLRATFELVNREWFCLVDHHTFIVVTQLSDVARLHSSKRRPDSWTLVRTKTRTIALQLDELEGREETEMLGMLLDQARATVSVVLNISAEGLRLHNGGEDGVGLVHALGRLANVRHCELRWLDMSPARPDGAHLAVTQTLARSWPMLESVELEGIDSLSRSPATAGLAPFAQCPSLRRLACYSILGWCTIKRLLNSISPNLNELHLIADNWSLPASPPSPTIDQLAAAAPRLVTVDLTSVGSYYRQAERGQLDGFFGRLSTVRRLTLQPRAVSNLAGVLGPLACLTDLVLACEAESRAEKGVDVFEVAVLVRVSGSLERLGLSESIRKGWSKATQDILVRVARNKGVKLVCVSE